MIFNAYIMSEQTSTNTSKEQNMHQIPEEVNLVAYTRFIGKLRPLAYSSEVGESFRHLMPKLVVPLYALSFAYIGVDMGLDIYKAKPADRIKVAVERSIWHSMASIVFPAVVINRAVWFGRRFLFASSPRMTLYSTLFGLATIPFIVHPIDHGVDKLCDNYIFPRLNPLFE